MSRTHNPSYLTPVDTSGVEATPSAGDSAFGTSNRGVFTLAAGTYFVPVACADSSVLSLHTQGDSTIAITSVTLEETNMGESEVPLYSDATGAWLPVDDARISSTKEGTGWTNTNDVIGNGAGNAGGGIQTVVDCGTRRMRAKIVVGTGGQARFAAAGKD